MIVCGLCAVCCSKESVGIERFEGKFSGSCEYVSDTGRSYHNITIKVKVSSNEITVRSISGYSLPTLRYRITDEYDTKLGGYKNDSDGYSYIDLWENSLVIEYYPKGGGNRYRLDLDRD